MPFKNTHIESFYIKVLTILEANDNKLTIDTFGKTFDTPVYKKAFADENSLLVKCLRHRTFKSEGMGQDEIDPRFLLALALFVCVGTTEEKAHVFYHLL